MSEMTVPRSLEWWRDVPGGVEWLARLPSIVERCAERWRIEPGRPLHGGNVSLVLSATRADGTPVVLKVSYPDRESEHEADALALWAGAGAVRILEHDRSENALLLERCNPGRPLSELDDDPACEIVIGLLARLMVPPPRRFRHLANEAARWCDELPRSWERYGRPFERRLLDTAVSALEELAPTQGSLVLANEDIHAGNVLSARREPWLVIDPKPIAAEREFTPVAMIRDRKEEVLAGTNPLACLRRRLDRFSCDLLLDGERLRLWTLAHTLAWGFGPDGAIPAHVEIARLLRDA